MKIYIKLLQIYVIFDILKLIFFNKDEIPKIIFYENNFNQII